MKKILSLVVTSFILLGCVGKYTIQTEQEPKPEVIKKEIKAETISEIIVKEEKIEKDVEKKEEIIEYFYEEVDFPETLPIKLQKLAKKAISYKPKWQNYIGTPEEVGTLLLIPSELLMDHTESEAEEYRVQYKEIIEYTKNKNDTYKIDEKYQLKWFGVWNVAPYQTEIDVSDFKKEFWVVDARGTMSNSGVGILWMLDNMDNLYVSTSSSGAYHYGGFGRLREYLIECEKRKMEELESQSYLECKNEIINNKDNIPGIIAIHQENTINTIFNNLYNEY
jgi:hypothetical protein